MSLPPALRATSLTASQMEARGARLGNKKAPIRVLFCCVFGQSSFLLRRAARPVRDSMDERA